MQQASTPLLGETKSAAPTPSASFTALRQKADRGEQEAQLMVGLSYLRGLNNCVINETEAHKWIKDASVAEDQKDSPIALCAQGLRCEFVERIKDPTQAKDHYTKAAEQKCTPAMYELARRLFEEERLNTSEIQSTGTASGLTVYHETKQQNNNEDRRKKIVSLLTQCAKSNYSQAEHLLGKCHILGWGVQQDFRQAFNLIQPVAQSGDAAASHTLGTLYQRGRGTKENRREARKCFEAAARQNLPESKDAMKKLGMSCCDNEIVHVCFGPGCCASNNCIIAACCPDSCYSTENQCTIL